MGFWDRYAGDRYKFTTPGDTIEGTLAGLSATDFGDGPVPVLTITTAKGGLELTASQRVLQSELAQQSPEVGDWLKITYDGEADNARPGRSPAKLFTVIVKKAERPVAGTTDHAAAGTPEDADSDPF